MAGAATQLWGTPVANRPCGALAREEAADSTRVDSAVQGSKSLACARRSLTPRSLTMPMDDGNWQPVRGYEDYLVDSTGRIWNGRFGRYMGSGVGKEAYRHVALTRGPKGAREHKLFMVARLVYEAFIGPIPEGYQIRFLDGDRLNCSAENLGVARPGRGYDHARGSGSGSAKLNEDSVRLMRQLHKHARVSQRALADAFGVTPQTVLKIVNRRSWRHVR